MNKDMDAVYILSPMPHIVDCLMADLDRRRYRRAYLIWTSRQLAAKPFRPHHLTVDSAGSCSAR